MEIDGFSFFGFQFFSPWLLIGYLMANLLRFIPLEISKKSHPKLKNSHQTDPISSLRYRSHKLKIKIAKFTFLSLILNYSFHLGRFISTILYYFVAGCLENHYTGNAMHLAFLLLLFCILSTTSMHFIVNI